MMSGSNRLLHGMPSCDSSQYIDGGTMEQNLSAYKIFFEVASLGNISRAAKKLYISQPAISKSIVKLEDNLDTRLFHRNSRGVTLTAEGEVLYRYIQDAFRSIDAAELELRRMQELNIGHIKIGASTTLCRFLLLPYLKAFVEEYPNIQISIETQGSAENLQLLEQKKLDIGLLSAPGGRLHPDLHSAMEWEIQDTFVATPQYLENLHQLCGEDYNVFEEANLMLLDNLNVSRRHVNAYFKTVGIEPIQLLEVSTMDLLIEFAKLGIGVSCVVRQFVEKEIAEGSLVELPLDIPIPRRHISFLYHEQNRSKSLDAFLEVLSGIESPQAGNGDCIENKA